MTQVYSALHLISAGVQQGAFKSTLADCEWLPSFRHIPCITEDCSYNPPLKKETWKPLHLVIIGQAQTSLISKETEKVVFNQISNYWKYK